MKSLKNIFKNKVQLLPQIIGYCGLLPHVVAIILNFYNLTTIDVIELAIIYSYTILAFLGGIYWGVGLKLEIKFKKFYLISILPTILILINLIISGTKFFNLIFILLSLNFFLLLEIFFLKNYKLFRWFFLLRIRLNILFTGLIIILVISMK